MLNLCSVGPGLKGCVCMCMYVFIFTLSCVVLHKHLYLNETRSLTLVTPPQYENEPGPLGPWAPGSWLLRCPLRQKTLHWHGTTRHSHGLFVLPLEPPACPLPCQCLFEQQFYLTFLKVLAGAPCCLALAAIPISQLSCASKENKPAPERGL